MRKIDELRQELSAKKEEVRNLLNENKVAEAEAKMTEVRNLEANIKLQAELDEQEQNEIDEKRKDDVKMEKRNVVDQELEYRAIGKYLLGKELTQEERASVNVGNSGAILPQGFVKQVQVLTDGFPSLKKYAHVIPVSTNSGKMPISNGSTTKKLAKLATDTEMVKEMITTTPVEYAVEDFGKILPVENSVLEDAGVDFFNQILAPDFAECAVNTENAEILAIVKANAVPGESGSDYKAIIKTLNKKVKPSLKSKTVILTNQSGYDYLDGITDNQGRPLLSDSLAVEGGKTLKGREILVLDDTELEPVTEGKLPFYIVNLYVLIKLFDRKQYEIAISKEAGFTYNQTFTRVVERFDVVKGDNRANFYVELSA